MKTKKTASGIRVYCSHDKIVPVDELVPNPQNPNQHPDEQIELLAKIIQSNGWRNAITVSNLSGMIVKGHGRYAAAQLAGLDEVPVDYQDYESRDNEIKDLIADNKISELSVIDTKEARALIESLESYQVETDFDLSDFGFTNDEILEYFPDERQGETADDEVPEVDEAEVKTKTGDLYLLGRHRLLCGDATKAEDVERLMDGEKADMVFTSPPYNLGNHVKLSNNVTMSARGNSYILHDDKIQDYCQFCQSAFDVIIDFAEFLFLNIQLLSPNKNDVIGFIAKNLDHLSDVAIWNKGHAQPAMAEMVMDSVFEFIFIFRKNNQSRKIGVKKFRGGIHNVFNISPQRNNEFSKIHAATFPAELPITFINNFTNIDSIVIDQFLGTGTTLIACEKTNRICYGMEIDPHYCDVIVKRWEDYTGETAKLT